jgi:hypothetical protein
VLGLLLIGGSHDPRKKRSNHVLPGWVQLGGVFCTNEFALPEGRWEGGREKRQGALGSEMVRWDFKCAYEHSTSLSIRYVAICGMQVLLEFLSSFLLSLMEKYCHNILNS